MEETRKYIGADTLAFLPLSQLRGMLGEEAPTFCDACLSGEYPVLPTEGASSVVLGTGKTVDAIGKSTPATNPHELPVALGAAAV